jgi:hypothetical protein
MTCGGRAEVEAAPQLGVRRRTSASSGADDAAMTEKKTAISDAPSSVLGSGGENGAQLLLVGKAERVKQFHRIAMSEQAVWAVRKLGANKQR